MNRTLVLMCLVLILPGAAFAEGPFPNPGNLAERTQQAQYFADQAYVAYQHEDWPKAIAAYLESYKQSSTADVLYNVAVIYERKLGNKQQALEYYRKHNAAADTKPELVAKAQARIDELTRDPGTPATQKPATTVTAPAAEPARSARGPLLVTGIVAGVVGLAGIGVGAGFGTAAMKSMDEAKAAGCANGACLDAASALKVKTAFAQGNTATIAFVAGGVLVAAGATLAIIGLNTPADAAPHASLQLTPMFGPGQAGASLSGSF